MLIHLMLLFRTNCVNIAVVLYHCFIVPGCVTAVDVVHHERLQQNMCGYIVMCAFLCVGGNGREKRVQIDCSRSDPWI